MIMANDFETMLTDAGVTVSLERNTESYGNISGSKSSSYGSPSDIVVLLGRHRPKFAFEKEGLVEQGDRTMLSRTSDAVNKNDRITYDVQKFTVHDVSLVDFQSGSTQFTCHKIILFKID